MKHLIILVLFFTALIFPTKALAQDPTSQPPLTVDPYELYIIHITVIDWQDNLNHAPPNEYDMFDLGLQISEILGLIMPIESSVPGTSFYEPY